jgi:hypothetical protein
MEFILLPPGPFPEISHPGSAGLARQFGRPGRVEAVKAVPVCLEEAHQIALTVLNNLSQRQDALASCAGWHWPSPTRPRGSTSTGARCPPAHGLSSFWRIIRGRSSSLDNYIEVQARTLSTGAARR